MDVALWSESIDYEGRRARLVICEDVTLKQALEAALMRKANLADQLKNIAATVPGAIFAFLRHEDGVYSFPYIDGKQLEALGFSAEDFSSDARPLIGLVHPDDISALLESIEMSARAMAAWHGQFRILHPHLGVRWIEGDSIPQLCADGSVLWHGYLSDATERIEATRRLEQSHAQIQALLAHMEVVREEERTRIARELHDELGQTLTAIRMNLRQLSSLAGPDHPEMDSRLNDVEAIVEEAMLSVRRISQELHPRILDTLGLGGAIEWETGEFRKRMGIRCRCVVPQADIDLPETFKTHIYRLFQEAMTNISRHARATAVDVTLSCDGNILSLQVAGYSQRRPDGELPWPDQHEGARPAGGWRPQHYYASGHPGHLCIPAGGVDGCGKGKPMNLLIVDDHPLIRQGLAQVLRPSEGFVIRHEARTAAEALDYLRTESYDVVVLDINIPDQNGLELTKQFRSFNRHTPVLILSMLPEESLAIRSIKAGADGYVSKESPPETLVEALRKLAQGRKHFSPELLYRVAQGKSDLSAGAAHEKLSNREYQVLCMLAGGKSIAGIAEQLELSPNTVSTYRTRILEKLEMGSNADLTRYAIANQLI